MSIASSQSNLPLAGTSPSGPVTGESANYESFRYNQWIVRQFILATLVWGFIGLLFGLAAQVLLLKPTLADSFPNISTYLTYGKLRPVYANLFIYGFVSNAVFAGIYFSTQRLCRTRLWSNLLGGLHFLLWQLIVVAGLVTLPLGISQGKEYAELEWPIDIAIAVVWVLFFAANFFATLFKRRQRYMYISLWFYIATVVLVGIYHIINSVVIPVNATKSYPIYAGAQDALIYWFYGRNAIEMLLILPFLGLMYYVVPKAAGKPIYSYQLAVVQFWSLILLLCFGGLRSFHNSPIPEWVSTLGVVFGIMLWVPSWGAMLNGLWTLRSPGKSISSDPVLQFFFAALIFYGLGTLESSLLSFKSINAMSHFSEWAQAHELVMLIGWAAMVTLGTIHWILPQAFRTRDTNSSMARFHFWLALAGTLVWISPIYAAGFLQNSKWNEIDSKGQLVNPDFVEILNSVTPFWWLSSLGMVIYLIGIGVLFLSYLNAFRARNTLATEDSQSAIHYRHIAEPAIVKPVSVLHTAPVLEFAKKLDAWRTFYWHRVWERHPLRFALLIAGVVVAASLLEILPVFVVPGNIPAIASVQPYTPLELIGRDIYVAEGCQSCHTQLVRPLVTEVKRFGQFSKTGEFVYDHPHLWGVRRIGRDLAREGGRQSSLWQLQHLENPRANSPGSLMPNFAHLLTRPISYEGIQDTVWAANVLGAGNQETVDKATELAKKQAQEIAAEIISQGGPIKIERVGTQDVSIADIQAIAVIAYLQRIGSDLFKPEPSPVPTTTAATQSAAN